MWLSVRCLKYILIKNNFRSCEIKKMFLLIRCKKTISIQERLTKLLTNPVSQFIVVVNNKFIDIMNSKIILSDCSTFMDKLLHDFNENA